MAFSPLAKKLRLHDAHRAIIINAPEGYIDQLGDPLEGIEVMQGMAPEADFGQLFVKDRSELADHVDALLSAITYDAILWICYPKGGSGMKTDLNRDQLWQALAGKDIRPVSQVSIDQVWSAMRFRPLEKVGK